MNPYFYWGEGGRDRSLRPKEDFCLAFVSSTTFYAGFTADVINFYSKHQMNLFYSSKIKLHHCEGLTLVLQEQLLI